MSIQKYEAFLKTVECESFTKAAEMLGYTQSGVSHMIRSLEEEWGISLLDRDRSGIRVTSVGITLLPYIRNVCLEQYALLNELEELRGLRTGIIRIGTFSSVATHWLPNMIKEFQKDYPNINFELLQGEYNEIKHWIREGRVDCGFLRLPTDNDLEVIFLEQDRLMVILPENHPLAGCDRFPIRQLSMEPFILLAEGSVTESADLFIKHKVTPQVRYTTWDDYAIMSMVECGLGISILPELVLRRTSYHIVQKELECPAFRKIGIAVKDRKHTSFAVKRFLNMLCDVFSRGNTIHP